MSEARLAGAERGKEKAEGDAAEEAGVGDRRWRSKVRLAPRMLLRMRGKPRVVGVVAPCCPMGGRSSVFTTNKQNRDERPPRVCPSAWQNAERV